MVKMTTNEAVFPIGKERLRVISDPVLTEKNGMPCCKFCAQSFKGYEVQCVAMMARASLAFAQTKKDSFVYCDVYAKTAPLAYEECGPQALLRYEYVGYYLVTDIRK